MMLYIIWDVDPQIFTSLGFLRWYGLSWAIGVLVALRIMRNIYDYEGIPPQELEKLTTYLVFGGVLGARLGHVLFYDPIYYWNNPIEMLPIKLEPNFHFTGLAGLASHGGIFGSLLALYLYNRNFKRNYLWLLDRLTIAFAVLGGLIRLGNLMNSEIIGIRTNLPWAFIFTRIDDVPRHPAQLYEAIFYFTIGILLYRLWKSRRFSDRNGFIFGLGIALMFAQRFFIEFLKEDQVAFEEQLALNMGQILSIPLITVGVLIIYWSTRKTPKKLEAKTGSVDN